MAHDPKWVDAELVRHLPSPFVEEYEGLISRIFEAKNGSAGGVERAPGRGVRARLSTSQTETRSGAHNARRSGLSTRAVIRDERALVVKSRIDRKLRALARDIRAASEEVRNELRRCTRCRTFAEGDWNFCPRDGAPTEQVD